MKVRHNGSMAGTLACSDPENPSPKPRPHLVAAPEWAPSLQQLGYSDVPSYRALSYRAADGRLGVQVLRLNGRLHVREADLPAMARHLGLTPSSGDAAPRALADHVAA